MTTPESAAPRPRKPRRARAPRVVAFADYEVIVRPVDLSHAVAPGSTVSDSLDPEAIARAERALGTLEGEFAGYLATDLDALAAARRRTRSEGLAGEARDALYRASLDIRGGAATFGFPLAGEVAASLCRLIDDSPLPDAIPDALIDRHIEAMRAIHREGVRAADDPLGLALAQGLAGLVDTFLEAMPPAATLPETDAPGLVP